jgi:hypothetical protein
MSGIEIDTSHFPLVRQVLHPGLVDDDIDHMAKCYQSLFANDQRYSLVVVASDAGLPSAVMRRRLSEWETQNASMILKLNVGVALVLRSAIQRGALTALNWIRTPVVPQKAMPTERDAVQWCVGRLLENDIVPTLNLSNYVDRLTT